ncbi:CPBP family glutamic-type intramembrane protease [Thalassotalea sediminis]|uniref:CPBP family glutamic-type intramembrane protease n=1 Tax=Thalassotalea sediminis TaxID=1759089 RepID=UPI002573E972|nr:CPBP family glutamic-type intramembrane protease [Thalassotalea sediminis]
MKVQCFNLLEDTERSLFLYALKIFILVFTVGIGVISIMSLFVRQEAYLVGEFTLASTLKTVFLAPFIETLLMVPVIEVLKKFLKKKLYIGLISGIFWACLHSLVTPLWGIGVFFLFYMMTLAYLFWQEKSTIQAIYVVMIIHALNNASVLLFVFLTSYFT